MCLVGDSSVGKTCLIYNYLNQMFTEDYEPTNIDVYRGSTNAFREQIEIEIIDTGVDGSQTCYQGVDIFMICVSTNE